MRRRKGAAVARSLDGVTIPPSPGCENHHSTVLDRFTLSSKG
jgi:hypothetical protein